MHLVGIHRHNIVFQRLILVEMNLANPHLCTVRIRLSKAHMYFVCFDCLIQLYNIINVVIYIVFFQQPGTGIFRGFCIFRIPVFHPHKVNAAFLVCCCKCKVIYLVICIQCNGHALGCTRIMHAVIPVRFTPVRAVIIIHKSKRAVFLILV